MNQLYEYRPLGSLRFLFAFFVIFAHSNVIYNPLEWLYTGVYYIELANIGVWGFFVTSGFIVFRAIDGFYSERPREFLVNRSLRIYPLFVMCYLLSLMILFAMGRETIDPKVPPPISIANLGIAQFTLGMSIFGFYLDANVFNPNTPAWTIYVEVLFYLIAAGVCAARKRYSRLTVYLVTMILFCILYLVPAFSSALVPQVASKMLPGQLSPIKYLPFFLVGVSIHYCTSGLGSRRAAFGSLCFSSVLMAAFIVGIRDFVGFLEPITADETTVGNLIGMGLVVVVLFILSSTWYSKLFSMLGVRARKLDRLIGDFTYPLYLCHVPLLAALWSDPNRVRSAEAWFQSFAICLLVSALILIVVDWPVQRIRDRFRGQKLA